LCCSSAWFNLIIIKYYQQFCRKHQVQEGSHVFDGLMNEH
jgi:hypothetical protein